MPAIIKNHFRHYNAENFIEAFSEASNDDLYIFIGKNDAWSGTDLGNYYGGEGINYTSAPTVTITGGGGLGGGTGTASINADGQITGIAVGAGGDYDSTPTVTITGGGGTGGSATAVLTGRAITSFVLTPVDADNPPTPSDTQASHYFNWDSMIAAKKVPAGSVSYVVKRVDWTSGTTYDKYEDHIDDIEDRNFFVMTDEFNIYKCISNNEDVNNVGSASTVKPTGQLTTVFSTGDGYKWKFMSEVRSSDILSFLTVDWMPIRNLTSAVGDDGSQQYQVQQAAVDGSIAHVRITNGGTGYAGNVPTVAAVGGGGSGFAATATETGGVVDGITITNEGSGYRPGTTITLTGGGGSDAAAVPIISPRNSYVDPDTNTQGGHGSSAKDELGAFFVMLNVRLEGADGSGDFPVGDDFRQVGVVLNPEASGARATGTTYGVGEFDDNTGRILYMENRKLINRAASQTEDIKLIIAF